MCVSLTIIVDHLQHVIVAFGFLRRFSIFESKMSFALVKFYEEDAWEVICVTDIILEEGQQQGKGLEGLKTLVKWKGKVKVPAQIIKISGMIWW